MIAELDFGNVTAEEHPDYAEDTDEQWDDSDKVRSSGTANKCTMEKIRVMTFVINNQAASNTNGNVRKRLRQLFLDAARYQVDYIGGDANGAIYKYYNTQDVCSIKNSSFSVMLNTYVAAVNTVIRDPKQKLHAQLVSSNSADTLDRLAHLFNVAKPADAWVAMDDQCLSIDCLVGVVFSWGHSSSLVDWRQEHAEEIFQRLPDRLLGYPEYVIKVAEYPMMLNNHHLWLNTRGGGDKDWHTPLIIRIRTIDKKSLRKRTAAALGRRRDRNNERRAANRRSPPQTSWSSTSWNQWWDGTRW